MTCLICGEPALVVDVSGGDYEEGLCPKCGQYRVTDTAILLLKAQGWRFDVELARKWIAEHKDPGMIPTIDPHQVARMIDVESVATWGRPVIGPLR